MFKVESKKKSVCNRYYEKDAMSVKVIYEHTLHVLKLTAERTLNKQGVLAIFGITHFAYAVFTKFFRQDRCL